MGHDHKHAPLTQPLVLAVAGALVDKDGRVLIAERPEGKIMPGYWEFPGGKIEKGETPEAALRRELREEVGIELGCMAPLSFISEARKEYHVVVMLYVCREWEGIPQGMEGQAIQWVRPLDLMKHKLLPSNVALVPIIRDFI
jgi:8-oxo-dGTP diphosphatase